MSYTVFNALLPVVLLICVGWVAGKLGWISSLAVKDLSNLIFMVVLPALLFRTMAQVHPEVALAVTFSNTVMIGIALIGITYGAAGLAVLLPIVSLHALVMLTLATLVLEFAVLRENTDAHQTPPAVWKTVLQSARNAIIHPVPLPIICGLIFAQTGLQLPEVIDKPLLLVGQSFSPLALILVGITLANTAIGAQMRTAVVLSMAKNLLLPLMVGAAGWLLGLRGLPLMVIIVTASLPIGANVFLFSQRYAVAEDLITASVAVSTVLALPTVALAMWLVQYL
jgi:malonate transporter and related proteins